jgi:DNA repair protein RecO (recombination protein O)
MAGVLQPGAQLAVQWHARLDDQLGNFRAEPLHARAALMGNRGALSALNAICALLHLALPERDPHPALYVQTVALLDLLEAGGPWAVPYLLFELRLLEDMGYGLDLTSCALTGVTQDLAYISPRTGRAVARTAAGDWAPRLLPLPRVLTLQDGSLAEVAQGLAVTGHFLSRALMRPDTASPLPEARGRLLDHLSQAKTVAD